MALALNTRNFPLNVPCVLCMLKALDPSKRTQYTILTLTLNLRVDNTTIHSRHFQVWYTHALNPRVCLLKTFIEMILDFMYLPSVFPSYEIKNKTQSITSEEVKVQNLLIFPHTYLYW